MQLVDVNVLVYAHREDASDHDRYRAWLESWLSLVPPRDLTVPARGSARETPAILLIGNRAV